MMSPYKMEVAIWLRKTNVHYGVSVFILCVCVRALCAYLCR